LAAEVGDVLAAALSGGEHALAGPSRDGAQGPDAAAA